MAADAPRGWPMKRTSVMLARMISTPALSSSTICQWRRSGEDGLNRQMLCGGFVEVTYIQPCTQRTEHHANNRRGHAIQPNIANDKQQPRTPCSSTSKWLSGSSGCTSVGRYRDNFCHEGRFAGFLLLLAPVSCPSGSSDSGVASTRYNCERWAHSHCSFAQPPSPTGSKVTSHAASRNDHSL